MLNPTEIKTTVPKSFEKSLRALSADTTIHPETLKRLAIYEFLVKYGTLKGEDEERKEYDHLLGHFKEERRRLFELPVF